MVCHQADKALEGSGDSSPRDMDKGLCNSNTRMASHLFVAFASSLSASLLSALTVITLHGRSAPQLVGIFRSKELSSFLYSQRLRSKA